MINTTNTHRNISLTAGILYLLTFISIPTISLYGPAKSAGYILSSGSDTGAIVGVMLEVVMALACIGTAVVLYPVLKKQNEILALGLVASRILEAGAIFLGVAAIMSIVSLHQAHAGVGFEPTAQTFAILYDRIFLQSQSFLPAVNDLLLGILLYKSRLVPRGLSLIGIIGAFPLLAGYVAVMLGATDQHGSMAGLAAIMVALFEFALGIWLVVKGFNKKALADLDKK